MTRDSAGAGERDVGGVGGGAAARGGRVGRAHRAVPLPGHLRVGAGAARDRRTRRVAHQRRRGRCARPRRARFARSWRCQAGGSGCAGCMPAGEGANVVARLPAAGRPRADAGVGRPPRRRAHRASSSGTAHDRGGRGAPAAPAQHRPVRGAGRRAGVRAGRAGRAGRWSRGPRRGRGSARALLAAALVADLDIATERTVPGANDNATGVAAVLALAQRFAAEPLAGVEVVRRRAGLRGVGDGRHGGLAARARDGLDPAAHARPLPRHARLRHADRRSRPRARCCATATAREDLDLADAGAGAPGWPAPERWRIGGWTDAILAVFAGLPAISLLSLGPKGIFTHYHHPTDMPEHVDFGCVERVRRARARNRDELRRARPVAEFAQVNGAMLVRRAQRARRRDARTTGGRGTRTIIGGEPICWRRWPPAPPAGAAKLFVAANQWDLARYAVYVAGAEANHVTLTGHGRRLYVLRDPNVPIAAARSSAPFVDTDPNASWGLLAALGELSIVPVRDLNCLAPRGRARRGSACATPGKSATTAGATPTRAVRFSSAILALGAGNDAATLAGAISPRRR